MKKILLVIVLILVSGGAVFSALGGTSWLQSLGIFGEERLVRACIEDYWLGRMTGDDERMANYVHPEQGGMFSSGMLATDSYEIQSLEIDGDVAVAEVAVVAHLKHPLLSHRTRELTLQDTWVRFEGKWYRDVMPISLGQMIRMHEEQESSATESNP